MWCTEMIEQESVCAHGLGGTMKRRGIVCGLTPCAPSDIWGLLRDSLLMHIGQLKLTTILHLESSCQL